MREISAISDSADIAKIEEIPYGERGMPDNTFSIFERSAEKFGDRVAFRFLPQGRASDQPVLVTYKELLSRIKQAANLFCKLGIKDKDVVSVVLPNLPQSHYALWGAQVAGIVNPVNPFLEPEAICSILNATGSKVVVTLGPSESREIFEKIISIVDKVPTLECILMVTVPGETAGVGDAGVTPADIKFLEFDQELGKQNDVVLLAEHRPQGRDVAAYFHTGGTTGRPKVVGHTHANQTYMAYIFSQLLQITENDVAIGGLPLFHVNAVFTAGLANFHAGASVVILGPDGFRNKRCVQDLWKTVEKYRATWISGVPTFYSSLLSIPVGDCDISSLRLGLVGAAPASPELFRQFEKNSGIRLLEGYGLSEGTCLSSLNPYAGEKRIGSIGLSIPYQEMKAVELNAEGCIVRDCDIDETGTLVIRGPNVFQGYLEDRENAGGILEDGWLNTGDLARCDEKGYYWLTGRAKDLIIRSGHNIDPKSIEDAIAQHPAVALVAAVGQPDTYAGELPAVYLTRKPGQVLCVEELLEYARCNIGERAAVPIYFEILDKMPVTTVGKIYKPELRARAIERVLRQSLEKAGVSAEVSIVNKKDAGIVANIKSDGGRQNIERVLSGFTLAYSFER